MRYCIERKLIPILIASVLFLPNLLLANTKNGVVIWQKDNLDLEAEYGIHIKPLSRPKKIRQKIITSGVENMVDDLTNTKIAPLLQELELFYSQYASTITQQDNISALITTPTLPIHSSLSIEIISPIQSKSRYTTLTIERLTLHQAIELAINHRYQIRAGQLELEKVKTLEDVEKAKWYPQIDYRHSHNLKEELGKVDLQENGQLGNEDSVTTKWRSGFNIRQSLNFKKLNLDYQQSLLKTKNQHYKLAESRQALSFSVATLFLDTLHFVDKVTIADKFQTIVSDLKELVELRFVAGKVSLLDKKKMNLNLELTLAEQEHFQTQVVNASAFLSRAVGIQELTGSELVPVELGVEDFNRYRLLLQDFVKDNIRYFQSENKLALAENKEDILETAFYPSVDLKAGIDRNAAIVGEKYTRTSLVLDIVYSAWTGGADTAKLSSSRLGKIASQYELKAIEEEVFDEIEKSFTDYEQSVKEYKTYYKNRLISWDLFNIQYEAFKLGKQINLIELVSALTDWYNNYLKSKQSFYNALNNKNSFSIAIGREI